MDFRLPLCSVLNSEVGRRHKIPHRTLSLPKTSLFVRYLDSDDTRLPVHSLLNIVPQPAEDYETYTGEDDWEKKVDDAAGVVGDCGGIDGNPPRFDEMVQWVIDALKDIEGCGGAASDGVVLCGRWVVADDCSWVVPSRTPILHSPRDVFLAMRNSPKFLRDVHHQILSGDTSSAGMGSTVELTLAKAVGKNPANDFRVFVPYRLVRAEDTFRVTIWEGRVFAGVCQRSTDVCFPSLMSWDLRTHSENYVHVLRHIEGARLLERSIEADPYLRTFLLRKVEANEVEGAASPCSVLLLSVDVVFEGVSLPLYIVSAKVRCFKHDRLRDPLCVSPFIKEEDNNGSEEGVNAVGGGVDGDRSDGIDTKEMLDDSVIFFRLFRDVNNWNFHVTLCLHPDGGEVSGDVDKGVNIVPSPQRDRRFFVIASERSDLVLTKEPILKRGMPLEFLRPELLGDIGEGLPQVWKDRLLRCLSLVQRSQEL
ncbi:D123, putative [Trypanosoma equiperdum]|uniref:D123, putative n=1 Tax=Trypanosoma equiperdum TaxID=5694 RepID=A0A1G4IGD7_TRYEQ|nr:D123, putative [Trypanosoma equiperdum]